MLLDEFIQPVLSAARRNNLDTLRDELISHPGANARSSPDEKNGLVRERHFGEARSSFAGVLTDGVDSGINAGAVYPGRTGSCYGVLQNRSRNPGKESQNPPIRSIFTQGLR